VSLKVEVRILMLDKAFNNGEPIVTENENYVAAYRSIKTLVGSFNVITPSLKMLV
jgi:hypothetical protein